jgi:predicted ATPase/signal transduction histidine kinase/CheY-like chemotaxis protein
MSSNQPEQAGSTAAALETSNSEPAQLGSRHKLFATIAAVRSQARAVAMNDDGEANGNLADSAIDGQPSKLEQIHSGSRHTLYRNGRGGAAVVLKLNATEVTDGSLLGSVRHEFELLRDLNLPGIVKVLGLVETGSGLALEMEDAGDCNLAQRLRVAPFTIAAFLDIAVQLAATVAGLHEARIIHRDIHPGNIIWNSERELATLCDFAIAGNFPTRGMEGPNFTELEGTLPYMSPEQTGRTGRSVDWRADLYSLGATYYEMLTGAPPFPEGDAVALAHAQIARAARAPHEINLRVPPTLSRIVLRLLEKEPAQRYQSAEALAADLRQAKEQWLRSATIEPFPLASHEVPRGLSIPDKLYGRDEELRSLTEAFARTCAGGRELVLVTGGPGIGKSALVDRLRPSVSDGHGYYAAGKFDQLQRSVPFSGLAQALRSLVRQLLTESDATLDGWRERVEAAVAPNGQLLAAIVPELERIIGPQAAVAEVGPVESRNRFHLVVTRFLRVFAQPERPLVLLLDDLQWVDAASLQLLEHWVSDTASHHLLVIGVYRDNEVGPSHPLALSLSRLRDTGCDTGTIQLKPLGSKAITQLAADTFGEDATRLQFLAELIIRKSAGNPFFVRRLLHLMHAQGLFRFLSESGRWTWNEAEIERAPISDNVLDLMVLAISRLPSSAKQLLEIGAWIGYGFELSALADLTDLSQVAVSEQLWPAIEDGLLVPMHDTDKPNRQESCLDDTRGPSQVTVRFAHDRVQQAAYSLLSEEHRHALHHAIGLRLLDGAGDELDEKLFEIVDQLDLGEAHVVGDAERRSLVELNLAAGQKAKASAAYRAAFEYLTVARRHLGERAWKERPELTYTVHRELAESAYLAGEHATAEELVETSLQHVSSRVAKAELYGLRVLAATVAGDWTQALRWGREGLAVFGLEWPLEGLTVAIEVEAAAVMKNLGKRAIEDLIDDADVEDADIRASMRLLSLLCAPAYFSGAEVLTFLVSRAVNLSLMHGPSPYSAFGYVLYGGIHNARTGQYDIGYAFGKLALAMAHRFDNRAEECRTIEVFGVLVHAWKASLRDSLPLLKEGFKAGVESGETAFAAFNLNSVLINALPSGLPLHDLLVEAEVALDFALTQRNRTSAEIAIPFRQIARALTGRTSRPDAFDDQDFVEGHFLEEARNHETALGHYWVARLQLAYLMGEYESALRCSREAAKRIPTGILGMITSAEHVFYTALTMAAVAPSAAGKSSSPLDELHGLHAKLINWARHCPQNFAHKVSLVGAEIARLDPTFGDASTLYRAAIDHAGRERFIQDEALAHELRARFLFGEREPEFAAVHAGLARDRYHRWGAAVKVAALEREFPDCFRPEPVAARREASIDELALIKASQAISVETVPERLFEQILRVVVEVAGAQRGVLALTADGAINVHARIEAVDEVSVSLAEAPLEQCADLPSAIFRYVLRTREYLLLADATAAGLFVHDVVVQHRKIRSVLCIPLLKQSTVVGLIYLENNALAGAFAEELVEIGRVLAAQAVISLENSTLLEKLQHLTGALEERVADRTRQLTDQITARDKAETALRITEARQALLLELSDALRPLRDPDAIRQTAMRLLGEYLGVARAYYFNIERDADGGWVHVVERGYRNEAALPELMGAYALREFGSTLFEGLADGKVISVADIEAVDGVTEGQRAACRAVGVRALVNVPLLRDGSYTAGIGVHDTKRHEWTGSDFDLIREVAARTSTASERARAEAALREANQQKDEFLAMLAHELRNPLAPIANASEILGQIVRGDAHAVSAVDMIKRQSVQLTRLVDDLLDVSRITQGRIQLSRRPIELSTAVAQALETVEPLLRAKQHHVSLLSHYGPLYIEGDFARIVQCLGNILSNAAKYTEPGGKIRVHTRAQEGQAVIEISDNGAGIPAQLLPRVFELFVQSERTLDRAQGGLGVGLAVVKRLVEMHGGEVAAYSAGEGQGSAFEISLPLIAAPSTHTAQAVQPKAPRLRVLIVDDNADAADSLAILLKLQGHETHVTYNPKEALEGIQAFGPDVALLDLGLPGMDGYELSKRIRAMPGFKNIRLVALSGYGQAEDRRRTQAAGFNDHLVKPVEMAILERSLVGRPT